MGGEGGVSTIEEKRAYSRGYAAGKRVAECNIQCYIRERGELRDWQREASTLLRMARMLSTNPRVASAVHGLLMKAWGEDRPTEVEIANGRKPGA